MRLNDISKAQRLEREAERQGESDGRYGYPANHGDWQGQQIGAYNRGYVRGRATRAEVR